MPFIIDAHEDLAYNILTFDRDYRRAASETRLREANTLIPQYNNGEATVGWPDYQRGQVALVFATVFLPPQRYKGGEWDTQAYSTLAEAALLYQKQFDVYQRLCDEAPDQFRLVRTQAELRNVIQPWQQAPAEYPDTTHPVGLVLSMEGAEGLPSWDALENYWERGLRLIGPVWAGTRWCGGMYEQAPFSAEGRELLERMAELGYVLDIAHMTESASLTALDRYEGTIIASHANVRALLHNAHGERHFTDATIQRLIERDGIMGLVPFNRFLKPEWQNSDPRAQVTLEHFAAHIDYICQMAGDARHVAIGTDYDGGFGYPALPLEIDTIGDLQKIGVVLQARGYSGADIEAILHGNWLRMLEKALPER